MVGQGDCCVPNNIEYYRKILCGFIYFLHLCALKNVCFPMRLHLGLFIEYTDIIFLIPRCPKIRLMNKKK